MKITEMLMAGSAPRPANLDEDTIKLLLSHPDEYVMVKDKDGQPRVLKISKK